jgi:hypothetical protein
MKNEEAVIQGFFFFHRIWVDMNFILLNMEYG